MWRNSLGKATVVTGLQISPSFQEVWQQQDSERAWLSTGVGGFYRLGGVGFIPRHVLPVICIYSNEKALFLKLLILSFFRDHKAKHQYQSLIGFRVTWVCPELESPNFALNWNFLKLVCGEREMIRVV